MVGVFKETFCRNQKTYLRNKGAMTNPYTTNNPSSIFFTATGKAANVGGCFPQKLRTARPSVQHHSPKSQEVSIPTYYIPPGSPDSNSTLLPQTSLLDMSCVWLSGTPKMSFWMKRASQEKKWVTFMWRGRSILSCNTYLQMNNIQNVLGIPWPWVSNIIWFSQVKC